MLDYAASNALSSIARNCIAEISTIRKASKKRVSPPEISEVISNQSDKLKCLGVDIQALKHEIATQSGVLKERETKSYEKSTKDGWVVYEDCKELRDKFAAHQKQLEKISKLLDSGMTVKQVAVEMAPSPEWVNHWRDRIDELNNQGLV